MANVTEQMNDPRYQEMINILKMDQNVISSIEEMIKKFKKALIFLWIGLTVLIVGVIVVILVNLEFFNESFNIFSLLLLAIGFILLVIWFIFRRKAQKFKKTKVYPLLLKADWVNLYNSTLNIFFENTEWKIKDFELNSIEYGEIKSNRNGQHNRMIVEYKGANIVFNIKTEIEEIVHTNSKGSATRIEYKTHIHERLAAFGDNLVFEEPISLVKNKIFSKSDFETESVAFNKTYEIKSNNQLLAAKYFSPKVVDKYANIKPLKAFEYVELNEKGINSYLYKVLNRADYTYELAHFKIYNKLDKYLCGLISEMIEDLNKFYTNFVYIEPLI